MKILHHWLEEILQTTLDPEKTSHILTSVGLEVESMERISSVKGGLEGLVVGKVEECVPHPNADRLKLTKVNIGNGEALQIVCGAPNVAAGQSVIVALPGTTLYPSDGSELKIKKSKIRGVESQGMICAEYEIGLGKSHEGIIVLEKEFAPGTPANLVFPVFHDVLYEIGLTPNRADAASHYGVARDLKAWLNIHEKQNLRLHLNYPAELPEPSGIQTVDIEVLNPQMCRRYAGVVISGITNRDLPPLMKFRLEACGFRCIHPAVDITNYVLLEMGQPLHAFNYEKITGKKIIVGTPEKKIPFTLLDGSTIELTENNLVIGNEEDPMCLAGIYGGKDSGVDEHTKTIFLESAYFDSNSIRKTASQHKLKTESSFRFERGTNPEFVIPALHRAASLLLDICGGAISSGPYDVYPEKIEPRKVAFSYAICNELLGHEIPHDVIHQILEELEIQIDAESKDGALCYVPAFKYDVTRQSDLVEEIARIYGYDRIPPSVHFKMAPGSEALINKTFARDFLLQFFVHKGFYEVQGLSLEKESLHASGSDKAIRVLNPVSNDSAFLRGHLIFSGLQVLAHNLKRQQKDLRFFELGKIYQLLHDQYLEKEVLGIYTSGRLYPLNHYKADYQTGLSDHLGLLYSLADSMGFSLSIEEYAQDHLAGVKLMVDGKEAGFCGYPGNEIKKIFDIDEWARLCITQFDYTFLTERSAGKTSFREIPAFPHVRRDLAFVLDNNVRFESIMNLLNKEYASPLLREVRLFDVYEGKNIGEGKKSLALSFIFQSEKRTLKDEELHREMHAIARLLESKLGAAIRE